MTSRDDQPTAGPGPQPPDEPGTRATLTRWYGFATSFVAPATFLSALLFYYGYVSSRAQYAYFGLDVDTIGLGTREFVMRSPQALLAPLLLIALAGAGLVLLRQRLAGREISAGAVRRAGLGGVCLVGLGVALLLAFGWIGGWAAYPMLTPVLLATGLLLLAWSWHRRDVRRAATALLLLAAATCVFWATATLAEWTGRGIAQRTARDIGQLPAVVLDSRERLYLTDGVTEEAELPTQDGQAFRYRYRGLRLLIAAEDRMFLVPEIWTPAGSTLVVPLDDVRVRFRFVNDPP